MHDDRPPVKPTPLVASLHRFEEGALIIAFLVSMLLPLIDAIGRPFHGISIPGSATYRAQLTLWLVFVGGLLAARERRHLTLSSAEAIGKAKARNAARLFSSSVAAAVCAVLSYSAYGVVLANREEGQTLSIGLPVWVSECVMPIGLALIALRIAWGAADRWPGRLVAFGAMGAAFALGLIPGMAHSLYVPLLAVV